MHPAINHYKVLLSTAEANSEQIYIIFCHIDASILTVFFYDVDITKYFYLCIIYEINEAVLL